MTFPLPNIDWNLLMPVLTVIGTGVFVLLWELFVPRKSNIMLIMWSLAGLLVAGYYSVRVWDIGGSTFYGSVLGDKLSVIANLILIGSTALTVLFSEGYLRERKANFGELYPMLLWATAGAMLMASSRDLIIIFLGLETLSISLYVLAGLCREDRRSEEAAIKYFLLGAFASGFFLYGIALVYGGTGTSQLGDIIPAWNGGPASHTLLTVGVALLFIGIGFKAALVPFQWWTPDVYQGAPTNITAYMAAIAKTAAFVTLIRLVGAAEPLRDVWMPIVAVVAVVTMCYGNLLALVQNDVKRMLAYSSIAHAGYMLVGLLAGSTSAVLFYLLAYALTTIGSFAIVGLTAKSGHEGTTYGDMRGLWKHSPFAAALMVVFMLSLAGVPITAGFWGKWYLFLAAVNTNLIALAIVLAVNSVVSVYYYLRLVFAMYVEDELVVSSERPAVNAGLVLATLVCAVGILGVGFTADYVQQFLKIPVGG